MEHGHLRGRSLKKKKNRSGESIELVSGPVTEDSIEASLSSPSDHEPPL